MKQLLFISLLFAFLFLIFDFGHAHALTMSNSTYMLNGSVQDSSDLPNSPTPPASTQPYNLRYNDGFFAFSLSQNLVDFGPLSPTTPVVRTMNLSVTSPFGYSVFAQEDTLLSNP